MPIQLRAYAVASLVVVKHVHLVLLAQAQRAHHEARLLAVRHRGYCARGLERIHSSHGAKRASRCKCAAPAARAADVALQPDAALQQAPACAQQQHAPRRVRTFWVQPACEIDQRTTTPHAVWWGQGLYEARMWLFVFQALVQVRRLNLMRPRRRPCCISGMTIAPALRMFSGFSEASASLVSMWRAARDGAAP